MLNLQVLEKQTQELKKVRDENYELKEAATPREKNGDSQLTSLHEELSSLQKLLGEVRDEQAEDRNKLEKAWSENQKLSLEIQSLHAQSLTKDDGFKTLTEENNNLVVQIESLSAANCILQNEMRDMKGTLEEIQEQNSNISSVMSNLKAANESLELRNKDLKEKLAASSSELSDEKERRILELESSRLQWHDQFMKNRDDLSSQLSSSVSKIEELDEKLKTLSDEKSFAEGRLEEMSSHERSLHEKFSCLMEDKEKLDQQLEELRRNEVHLQEEKTRESEESKKYQDTIENLQTRLEENEKANEDLQFNHQNMIQQLEDLRKNEVHLLEEKSHESKKYLDIISNLDTRLKEYEEANADLRKKEVHLQEEKGKESEEKYKHENEVRNLQKRLEEVEKANVDLQENLKDSERKLEKYQQDVVGFKNQLQETTGKTQAVENELNEANNILEELKAELKEKSESLVREEGVNVELSQQNEELNTKIEGATVNHGTEVAELKTSITVLAGEKETLVNERNTVIENLEIKNREISSITSEYEKQLCNLTELLHEKSTALEKVQVDLDDKMTLLEGDETKILAYEEEVNQMKLKCDQLQMEKEVNYFFSMYWLSQKSVYILINIFN